MVFEPSANRIVVQVGRPRVPGTPPQKLPLYALAVMRAFPKTETLPTLGESTLTDVSEFEALTQLAAGRERSRRNPQDEEPKEPKKPPKPFTRKELLWALGLFVVFIAIFSLLTD